MENCIKTIESVHTFLKKNPMNEIMYFEYRVQSRPTFQAMDDMIKDCYDFDLYLKVL